MIYESNCVEDTYALAKEFSKSLKKGDIITLDGDLGAGKTAFTKGLADGLGITQHVQSPTFTIVNEYTGSGISLYHFDVYRIGDIDEMYDIGFDDYLFGDGICVIEWADKIKEILTSYYEIKITKDLEKGEDYRKINIVKVT
jgi:tRNA threonylcarbamoyladenosine biosynthesis protein TsaE